MITELATENRSSITVHEEKEKLLQDDFRLRLGTAEFSGFVVDPGFFVQNVDGLELLETPFTQEEIDSTIKSLLNDKSPGPDGFSNEFLGWPVIKQDFYNLCNDFYDGAVCLKSINSSYVTLVPKIDVARLVSDFRPISLLNSSVKLVTKLLANRLQPKITALVHKNQYDFIKIRTIQDCLAWAFEYIHLRHHSKNEIVILKLNFEKVFDKIEH